MQKKNLYFSVFNATLISRFIDSYLSHNGTNSRTCQGKPKQRTAENHGSNNSNNKIRNLEGVVGYNGDITQYLQEKGYIWEQLDEDSIKFRRDNELQNKVFEYILLQLLCIQNTLA